MPESNTTTLSHQSAHEGASPWRLWAWGSAAIGALTLAMLVAQPDVAGARLAIRVTARLSLLLFLLSFVASALWRRWPSPATAVLMRHRRQVGLLFATSHACHAMGIVCLSVWAEPNLWRELTPDISRWIGGAGYVAIVLMASTSSDVAVRWLGRPVWARLHRVCAHVIWLVFVLSCLKRVGAAPAYALPLLLLLAAMGLRQGVGGLRTRA